GSGGRRCPRAAGARRDVRDGEPRRGSSLAPRARPAARPPRSPWARVSFSVKLHSKQRLCGRIRRLDQWARIDEEEKIEQARHREHGLELVRHRLAPPCPLPSIPHLYDPQDIITKLDG